MLNTKQRDIHILRYFSSFISVSEGKIINITDPKLTFCPLASHLYKGFTTADKMDKEALKREIKKAIGSKIKDFGFFTSRRIFSAKDVAIPYGASEMLMFALNKKTIDVAVIVCDGAGTIITDRGDIAQGVGARMNSLLMTSPIKEIQDHLKRAGCYLIFENAFIDQVKGVEKAIQSEHKRIAVTVCGHDSNKLKTIRELEFPRTSITILSVCTTGISEANVREIKDYADIVWSCASLDIRETVGSAALLQISKQIPIFALTQKGVDLVVAYAQDGEPLRELNKRKQYLISLEPGFCKIKLGNTNNYLREEKLPVLPEVNFALAGA
ncbi:MAG: DUF2099 family protein [Candidatus Omnitrophica bacterium]|nr:DUF2099 family protein [Candidatus Omnitrophota bacterium]